MDDHAHKTDIRRRFTASRVSVASNSIASNASLSSKGKRRSTLLKRIKIKKKSTEPNFDIPGVCRIVLSATTQQLLPCIVGEDVTPEAPWIRIPKDTLEYDMDARDEISEFSIFRDQILEYPRSELLLGYIPDETRAQHEFYICLDAQAEDHLNELILGLEELQHKRFKSAIVRRARTWHTYGSQKEINASHIRHNRSMLMVELEGKYPFAAYHRFHQRLAEPLLRTYSDFLVRLSYTNTVKLQIMASTDPLFFNSTDCQTAYHFSREASTQYECAEVIDQITESVLEQFERFSDKHIGELERHLSVDGCINFYSNDYSSLIVDERTTRAGERVAIKEYMSIRNIFIANRMGVRCFVWHPMWTGVMAVSYSEKPACSYRTGPPIHHRIHNDTFNVSPVLIWSFVNILQPSLILETPSEVTCLAFCPYNEYLLAGGCSSGQVILWDLTNRLENAEKEETLTDAQKRYRDIINLHVTWTKNERNIRVVRESCVSNLTYSHQSPVSSIIWMSRYRKLTKQGKLIVEDDQNGSMQFITTGTDGRALVWDLKANPKHFPGGFRPQRKLRRLRSRPEKLTADISPYRKLHRSLKPIYCTEAFDSESHYRAFFSCLTVGRVPEQYELVNPCPNQKFSIFNRIKYRVADVTVSQTVPCQYTACTLDGSFFIAGWEGYDVDPGSAVNTEVSKVLIYGKYHDGPIMSLSRSDHHQDLFLTVGGKVFAIWLREFGGQPVIWRRCVATYTHGAWFSLCPSRVRLLRNDGHIEMWDFNERSDAPTDIIRLSECPLTTSLAYPRLLAQNYLALTDMRGCCRIFLLSRTITQKTAKSISGTYDLCLREQQRKLLFKKWQKEWRRHNHEKVLEKRERERKRRENYIESIKKKNAYIEHKAESAEALKVPESGQYIERARRRWLNKEMAQMSKSFLENRSLSLTVLNKQQSPLIKQQEDERQVKLKTQFHMRRANDSFELVHTTLPYSISSSLKVSSYDVFSREDIEYQSQIFKQYQLMEKAATEHVNSHQHDSRLNWLGTLTDGKVRRKLLDGYYSRYTHDCRRERSQVMKNNMSIEDAGAQSRKYGVFFPSREPVRDQTVLELSSSTINV